MAIEIDILAALFALLMIELVCLWRAMRRRIKVKHLPLGEWVQISANTRIKRHDDDSVEFESTLSAEHPTATWSWK